MLYKEELEKLNKIGEAINKAVGDKGFLSDFLMVRNQPHVRQASIDLLDYVCLDRAEVVSGDTADICLERTLVTLQRMRNKIEETMDILKKIDAKTLLT